MAATNENENTPSGEPQGESRRGSTGRSSSDATKRTPGTPAGAKATDEPLAIGNVGPRDALIIDGFNDGDYVPDAEDKGYHVGLVRQPVMAVVDAAGRVVGYEAVAESKFNHRGSLENLKAAHNAREKGWKEGRDFRTASPEPTAARA